ncbi:MAG: KEOPS complex N(6)-L-threonylcarbamoyladenine synthase Kae1, partial [Candidatus Diapherotrites archaeon]|nr:KEOPS complex N(6)-L-threonylcarbamoyladenine synthase Kae1 [Candidatus Diapherotrites archaeon]
LAVESTAHTFGIAIVDSDCTIHANEKHTHTTERGGLIPRELAAHHERHALPILKAALEKSGLKLSDIDVFAFSQGPGMGPALKYGAMTARMLSRVTNKPLLGVNHAVGHIELAKKLAGGSDPLVVYVSGGNTQLIGLQNKRYRVFGETLDIGIGNLLDSFGRAQGLGFPAGPKLDEQYFLGQHLLDLPYTVKGMDLVFSGLLTAAQQQIGKADANDLVYSLLHTAFAELTEVTERALAHTEKKEVLLTGGVAASKALQQMMQAMCRDRGAKLLVPPLWSTGDSGLLPAWLGVVEFEAGVKQAWEDTAIDQRERCDAVDVIWAR